MKAYFIGIGGIGVSALAQYYLHNGWEVAGSDIAETQITAHLRELGATVHTGKQSAEHIPADLDVVVVYSAAISQDNPELKRARELMNKQGNITQVMSYAEALGELTGQYKTIAVAGTHGKGTTTAMLAHILIAAGFDPTVICGTRLPQFGNSNFRAGSSEWLLVEADEAYSAFLHHTAYEAVITNIDFDHPEWFTDENAVIYAFTAFGERIAPNGLVIMNGEDHNAHRVGEELRARRPDITIHYFPQQEADKEAVAGVLRVPGAHNVENGCAALDAARALGITDRVSLPALGKYRGAWRRMQTEDIAKNGKQLTVVSDYAHHPAEVSATCSALREAYVDRPLWIAFQPHHSERWRALYENFLASLESVSCDRLYITDVYRVVGREEADSRQQAEEKHNPAQFTRTLNQHREAVGSAANARYMPFDAHGFAHHILHNAPDRAVIALLGAGNIHDVFLALTE